MENTLLIASAGAGKTTHIVREAIDCTESVLITTFTEENEKEIKNKFFELNKGVIPHNVTIKTWFSFLIEHGAKPYQGKLTERNINGLLLVNEKSALKYKTKKFPIYYKEEVTEKHFFSDQFQIYSDKISKFVTRCNNLSNGYVIDRITSLYKHIYIDEIQDMAGYDLEIIKLLLKSGSTIKIAGDPRQVTYHTHFPEIYKKYSQGDIQKFLINECKSIKYKIDPDTLRGSWRNNQAICDFANQLFPDYPTYNSLHNETTGHDGVFLVKEKDVERYLSKYSPTQLRYSRRKKLIPLTEIKNFGESKGATRDRVIIYPTKKISDWLFENKALDNFDIRCKFYVAITRAKYSVAIVCKNNIESEIYQTFQVFD
ncbi:UvrD-helicase domain-containing protein [Shouchella miscanthi]|uniref:UvrD-helicase domain-containing protein n=1 Tax=Shouchella miscanthi TaxID=2598861 RepID=UPI0011A040BA|nr:UvrD-helicase domain-containing protein [Shouchella miscanthi]